MAKTKREIKLLEGWGKAWHCGFPVTAYFAVLRCESLRNLTMPVLLRTAFPFGIALLLCLGLGACKLLQPSDPLIADVVGIDALAGQDLEMRMAVKLRLQNPNSQAVRFDGVALQLTINDQPFAAGVSDQHQQLAGFSEQLISVPMTVTAFSLLRQAYGMSQITSLQGLPYELKGKLGSGPFCAIRFEDKGELNLSSEPYPR